MSDPQFDEFPQDAMANAVATTEVQMLNALMRIEELLTSQLTGLRHIAQLLSPGQGAAKASEETKGRGGRRS